MAQPTARIRPLKPSDDKLAKFIIAKTSMEGLATANVKTVTHPITLSIWFGLACIFVQYMQWWPSSGDPWWRYLTPLPAFISLAAPILAAGDWINRPHFESQTQKILRRPDIADLCSYYSKHPSSGFWILEYGETFVGQIAIDATPSEGKAVISHLHVDEPYRVANAQTDLISYALKHAFSSSKDILTVVAQASPFSSYVEKALKQLKFRKVQDATSTKVGLYRWNTSTSWRLERKDWNNSEKST